MQKYRPDLTTGQSREQILAMRSNPELSGEMAGNYSNENKGLLGNAGVPVTDGTAYLAHFAGPQGAIKVLQADPTAPVGAILGPSVVKANPFLANMTAGDLAGWADKKMGAPVAPPAAPTAMTAPQTAPQQAPQMPQGGPQGLLAQPAPQGIMAAPQQAPQGVLAQPDPPDEVMQSLMAMPKPLQHLQIPMARPKMAGFSSRRA